MNAFSGLSLSLSEVNGSPVWKSVIKQAITTIYPTGGRGSTQGSAMDIKRQIPGVGLSPLISTATNTFTLCFRFLCSGSTGNPQVLFCNGVYSADGYAIILDDDGSMNLTFYDNYTNSSLVISDSALSTNTWYTIGIVVTSGNALLVYINGVPQTSFISSISPLQTPTTGTLWFNTAKAPSNTSFYGKLAEFIFYDSDLTATGSELLTSSFLTAPFG